MRGRGWGAIFRVPRCAPHSLLTAASHLASPLQEALCQGPPRAGSWGGGRGAGGRYRASRVGEFKESEDWSPLLLLLRCALEHDSEGDAGDSCSRTLG